MKALPLLLWSLVLQVALISGAQSEPRKALAYGGNGGDEFNIKCKDGYALFAYTGKAGKALDHIRPLCAEVQPNGATGPGQDQAGDIGGRGGDPIRRTCPANSVVTKMTVFSGNDNLVTLIDLQCANLQTKEVKPVSGRSEGKWVRNDLSACNDDEVGIGIHGRYGSMIDQIGLICEKKAVVQPKIGGGDRTAGGSTPVAPDPKVGCSGLSGDELAICSEHNVYRAKHGVPNLTWDKGLAANAAAWVKLCRVKIKNGQERFCHQKMPDQFNPDACGTDPKYAYGENLAWSGSTMGGAEAVDMWYCEIAAYFKDASLAPDLCKKYTNSNNVTGHFTQVVWRETARLGCAQTTCPLSGRPNVYWACEYDPPGNWNADKPGVLDRNVPRPVQTSHSGRRPGGSVQTQAVVRSDVDLYDQPGGRGNKIGVLRKGQKLVLTTCRADNWCQVAGGWVWGSFIARDGSR